MHLKHCVVVGGIGAFIRAILYHWDAEFGRSSCWWCTSCVFFVVILHPRREGRARHYTSVNWDCGGLRFIVYIVDDCLLTHPILPPAFGSGHGW